MHDYTVDSTERRTIIIGLALLGIFAAYGFNRLLDFADIAVPWWLDAPAAFGFASIFYTIFDRVLWHHPLLRRLRLVSIPDLRGGWQGSLRTSHSDENHAFTAEVEQTWTRMMVNGETAGSRSVSLTACIGTNSREPELTYTYRNEPKAESVQTMNIHYGTTTLRLRRQADELIGEYYTGRGRQTYGSLQLKREKTQ